MNRNYPKDRSLQPVKGIFVFNDVEELAAKAEALFKTLRCEVLTNHENRFTVKTSRGNMQTIKQCWLDNKSGNTLSQDLNVCVSRIIIGGAAG